MAVDRKYTCDLCRESIYEEGGTTAGKFGYGIFFGQRIVRKPLSESERHICTRCLKELWKEFSEEMK